MVLKRIRKSINNASTTLKSKRTSFEEEKQQQRRRESSDTVQTSQIVDYDYEESEELSLQQLSLSNHTKSSITNVLYEDVDDSENDDDDHDDNDLLLLNRLGGKDALINIQNTFYKRLVDDERLKKFFLLKDMVDKGFIKRHHYYLFHLAFTKLPTTIIEEKFLKTHKHLFLTMGLTTNHFHIILDHLHYTLQSRGFHISIINEAMSTLQPLEELFIQATNSSK